MIADRHPCPCCGYRTFTRPAGGTMQLCPVCAWEDTPSEAEYTNSNEVNLIPAQRHFLSAGACEDEYLSVVRPPLPEEARSEHWRSFDELCLQIIADIEREFHDVKRDGGTTLHQMRWVDGGDPSDSEEMKKAEREDPESTWQEIPAGKLARFSGSLVFLDDRGFLFYLPAFMRHGLVTGFSSIGGADLDGVLWNLETGINSSYRSTSFALLSHAQKQTAASFVFLIAVFGDEFQRPDGAKALRNGWSEFVPDFLKLALI